MYKRQFQIQIPAVGIQDDRQGHILHGQAADGLTAEVGPGDDLQRLDVYKRQGIAQLIDHVDGTDTAHSLVEHQDRFKIIFCGLVDLHGIGQMCIRDRAG